MLPKVKECVDEPRWTVEEGMAGWFIPRHYLVSVGSEGKLSGSGAPTFFLEDLNSAEETEYLMHPSYTQLKAGAEVFPQMEDQQWGTRKKKS